MFHEAFAVHTDTEEMWAILQMTCLIRREEESKRGPKRSLLLERLGLAPSPPETEAAEAKGESASPLTTKLPPPAQFEFPRPTPTQVVMPEESRAPSPVPRFSLYVEDFAHRIGLPEEGEVVIGRFDPEIGIAPDIDLTYLDQETLTISRRHARITASEGAHFLEDLGSTNGTKLNDKFLPLGSRARLKPGDRLTLGLCKLIYEPMPEQFLNPPPKLSPRFLLFTSFTGRSIPLPSEGILIIGRSDKKTGFSPDIDLAPEGDAGQNVSRRHAKLYIIGGETSVEDLGSVKGTKVNGTRLELGKIVPLKPGDQIWIGGCVLTYSVDLGERSPAKSSG
ncbi:MAG: FHA domain-containing protein [Anaerolineae bacterium]